MALAAAWTGLEATRTGGSGQAGHADRPFDEAGFICAEGVVVGVVVGAAIGATGRIEGVGPRRQPNAFVSEARARATLGGSRHRGHHQTGQHGEGETDQAQHLRLPLGRCKGNARTAGSGRPYH